MFDCDTSEMQANAEVVSIDSSAAEVDTLIIILYSSINICITLLCIKL
jgi:hypothetical protein